MAQNKILLNRKEDIIHPDQKLIDTYITNESQGSRLEDSLFIFIGLDANFAKINNHNRNFFNYHILPHLEDYQRFLRIHDYKFHHPFLLPEYNKGDGYKYHQKFDKLKSYMGDTKKQKLFLTRCNFSELLPYPTSVEKGFSINYYQIFQNEEVIQHINTLFTRIFDSSTAKVVFITPSMVNNLIQPKVLNKLVPEVRTLITSAENSGDKMYYKKIKIGIHSCYLCYHFTARVSGDNLINHAKIIKDHLNQIFILPSKIPPTYLGIE